jgi:hypothetical protein
MVCINGTVSIYTYKVALQKPLVLPREALPRGGHTEMATMAATSSHRCSQMFIEGVLNTMLDSPR